MAYNPIHGVHSIVAGDMSAASIISPVFEIINQDNVGVELIWTGVPVGTFSFQVSSDYARDFMGNVTNAGHWVSIPVTPVISAAGSADSAYVDMNQLSAPYFRVLYTKTSGTGVLNAYVSAKAV